MLQQHNFFGAGPYMPPALTGQLPAVTGQPRSVKQGDEPTLARFLPVGPLLLPLMATSFSFPVRNVPRVSVLQKSFRRRGGGGGMP